MILIELTLISKQTQTIGIINAVDRGYMATINTPPKSFINGWIAEFDGRAGIAQAMRSRFDTLTYDLGGSDALSYQHKLNDY
jgi:hypothetical protein